MIGYARHGRYGVQAYSDFLEQELLDLFERAAGRSPPEVELMKECSDILFALNEGDHLQSRFVFYVVTQVAPLGLRDWLLLPCAPYSVQVHRSLTVFAVVRRMQSFELFETLSGQASEYVGSCCARVML